MATVTLTNDQGQTAALDGQSLTMSIFPEGDPSYGFKVIAQVDPVEGDVKLVLIRISGGSEQVVDDIDTSEYHYDVAGEPMAGRL